MKRMNIIVDEELLERARRASGEKTYSGTITKLLEQAVMRQKLDEAINAIRAEGDPFNADYVAEMWPEVAAELYPRKRVSADERRARGKRNARRGTR